MVPAGIPDETLTALGAAHWLWQSDAVPGDLRNGHPPPSPRAVALRVLVVVVLLHGNRVGRKCHICANSLSNCSTNQARLY